MASDTPRKVPVPRGSLRSNSRGNPTPWMVTRLARLLLFSLLGTARAALTDPVTVGKTVYTAPFEQYSKGVALVLELYHMKRLATSQDVFLKTDWLAQLGSAHRGVLEDYVVQQQSSENDDAALAQVELAMNAFTQAAQLAQGVLSSTSTTTTSQPALILSAKQHLAVVYFHMGEVYSLSPATNHQTQARDYLVQSDLLYRDLLDVDKHFDDDDEEKVFLDEFTRDELIVSWAHCVMRLGVSLLQQVQEGLMEASQAYLDYQEAQETATSPPRTALDQGAYELQVARLNGHAQKAAGYFETAKDLFQDAVDRFPDATDRRHVERHLATAWHNLGTAALLQSQLATAAAYNEQALTVYNLVVPHLDAQTVEGQDTLAALVAVLQELSECYLQLGAYGKAKSSYAQAMDWYQQHAAVLQVPAQPPLGDAAADYQVSIQQYEAALEQYQELLLEQMAGGGGMQQHADEHGMVPQVPDLAYEADLHAGLGSLYMAVDDSVTATSHLTQAVSLYEQGGEAGALTTAQAKLHLAASLLQSGNFADSAVEYEKALDIYQAVVGEGTNPLAYDDDLLYDDQVDSRMMQGSSVHNDDTAGTTGGAGTTTTKTTDSAPVSTSSSTKTMQEPTKAPSKKMPEPTKAPQKQYQPVLDLDAYHAATKEMNETHDEL